MLDIVLLILKIIGILILGLILTIILLVLLVPVRYQIWASYHDVLKAKVRVSWLLRMLSVFVTYEKELEYAVRLLGFQVLSSDKAAQPKEDASDLSDLNPEAESVGEAAIPSSGVCMPEDAVLLDTVQHHTDAGIDSAEAAVLQTKASEKKPSPHISEQAARAVTEQGSPTPEHVPWYDKLKTKLAAVCDKIKALYHKADQIVAFIRHPDNQATFKLIFRQIKRILKHLLPRRLKADVVLGFDDPATTGQVLSICSFLYLWYADSVNITPVFDESIMEGDVELKGRIRLGTLIVLAVRILLDKNFRILLKRWRVNGGILDG